MCACTQQGEQGEDNVYRPTHRPPGKQAAAIADLQAELPVAVKPFHYHEDGDIQERAFAMFGQVRREVGRHQCDVIEGIIDVFGTENYPPHHHEQECHDDLQQFLERGQQATLSHNAGQGIAAAGWWHALWDRPLIAGKS